MVNYMPTKTQKEFRKQMKEIQRERLSKNNNEYYSYVARDKISSYYNKNVKRKMSLIFKILIPILIVELVFAFFYYGNNNGLFDIKSNKSNKPTSQIITSTTQRKIIDYIDMIQQFNTRIDDLSKQVQDIDINSYIEVINQIDAEINNLSVPDQVAGYHKYFIERISAYKDFISYYQKYSDDRTQNNTDLLNESINRMNRSSTNERTALIKCFEQNGIKYEVQHDGSIRYWYTENQF